MTTRPPQPSQRQPQSQRPLSGSGMLQKQAQQRSLLQQHQLLSSARTKENFIDLTSDATETSPLRPNAPRLAASMLKTEAFAGQRDGTTGQGLLSQPGTPGSGVLLPLPPRGKPRFLFKHRDTRPEVSKQVPAFSSNPGSLQKDLMPTPLPMPARPGRNMPSHARRQMPDAGSTAKKDTRPKPYVLEVPSCAPYYPPNGNADFFPWTGDHPEDNFTDLVIRHGYFDKSQTAQNETSSAKQTIYPALRQKNGLQTLGSLFAHVLAQRRHHGQVTSAPTFKPPPRVTLTDTKRETWLRDLANPLIPLRRLSRTIPHGIKNKVLLEQCTNKGVPTERAVWLAKCVGANEIRASKRKGVSGALTIGGESKWIRDWTVCVEQFVEGIISACGEKEWKSKILYAVRLASHLYSEQLLDPEHYLDWLLASVESTPLSKLPMWLLVAEIYWDDILRYRKSGRRIATALCSHLQAAHESPNRDLLLPLIERLVDILTMTIRTNPESFIALKTWSKYRTILLSCHVSNNAAASQNFAMIDRRNDCLKRRSSNGDEGQNSRRQVIKQLDTSLSVPFSVELSRDCWRTLKDRSLLTQTLLDWATSSHRPGPTKTFVASRLMRLWSRLGIDVDEVILTFLTSRSQESGVGRGALYHLISELARSGHFSTSKYIQWLIARGGLQGPDAVAPDGPLATRLLAELPTHDLPESLTRLRKTLLNRVSFSVEEETENITHISLAIESCLPFLYGRTVPDPNVWKTSSVVRSVSDLSRTVKTELGLRLRKQVNLCFAGSALPPPGDRKTATTDVPAPKFTLDEFSIIRSILEATEDLAMLADVLKLASSSSSSQILASVADTVNFHRNTLSAIGALKDLFDILVARQRTLAVVQSPDSKILLNSLCELAATIPGAEGIRLQLSQEIALSVLKTAVDACSPVSDHVTEVLQKAEGEFSDEIEKLLFSGNSMDAPTLLRLFKVLIAQMEASWTKCSFGSLRYGAFLERLRTFHAKQFDSLLATWLHQTIQSTERPPLSRVLGPLISARCLGFKHFLKICISILQNLKSQNNSLLASRIAFESLSLVLGSYSDNDDLSSQYAYTLNIKRSQAQLSNHSAILTIIRWAVETCEPAADAQPDHISTLCGEKAFHSFLQRLVLTNLDSVTTELVIPLAKSQEAQILGRLRVILRSLLCLETKSTSPVDLVPANRIETILSVASDLTLPFCQLALGSIFESEKPDWNSEDPASAGPLQAFERAVDTALANHNSTWTKIIPMLDVQIAQHLCERAERTFMDIIPSAKAQDLSTQILQADEELAGRMLFVIDATSYSMRNHRNPFTALQVVDKLNDLIQSLSQPDASNAYLLVEKWLPPILHFITLQNSDLDTSKPSIELRARTLLALSTLLLCLHSHHQRASSLPDYLFDVCLLLVDDLPDDARLKCVRIMTDKARPGGRGAAADPALRYIFGFGRETGEALVLLQKGKVVGFPLRRWENLSEPTPMVGENDAALSLSLFQARKG